ncbi:MAG TPA: ATP12 family protein [Aliidongia sp.]|nr:ATP12 family protein [Aliidongia sp.]
MKRFYREVSVAEVEGGFGVLLDGRALRTPAKRGLVLPYLAPAEALAAEWAAQDGEIRPATMPLMKLVSTALDLVADKHAAVAEEAANYAKSDLLCYRADHPPELIDRQARLWQPLLDWAALRFDAPLRVTAGILPVSQPPDSLKALRHALDGLEPLVLTPVADLTAVTGSLILALALWDGEIDAAGAFAAATLDEAFQIERWGEDAELTARLDRQRRDLDAAARLLALLD